MKRIFFLYYSFACIAHMKFIHMQLWSITIRSWNVWCACYWILWWHSPQFVRISVRKWRFKIRLEQKCIKIKCSLFFLLSLLTSLWVNCYVDYNESLKYGLNRHPELRIVCVISTCSLLELKWKSFAWWH